MPDMSVRVRIEMGLPQQQPPQCRLQRWEPMRLPEEVFGEREESLKPLRRNLEAFLSLRWSLDLKQMDGLTHDELPR